MSIVVRLAGLALVATSSLALAQIADAPVPGVMPATEQPEVPIPGVMPASSAAERRLTPQQVDAVLAESARRNHEIAVGTASLAVEQPCPTKPHGEMGVEAGTGGYSSIYGATTIPLGCHAAVSIAVGSSSADGRYYRGRRR